MSNPRDGAEPFDLGHPKYSQVRGALRKKRGDKFGNALRIGGACSRAGLTYAEFLFALSERDDLNDVDPQQVWTTIASAGEQGAEQSAGDGILYTDHQNAVDLVEHARATFRYCPEMKAILHWDGTRWQPELDDGPLIHAAAEMISNRATKPGDDDAFNHKVWSLSRTSLLAMVHLAKANADFRTPREMLDANPYELNTPDGVVNLKTGDVLPHSGGKSVEHWCTKVTAVGCDFEAPCPLWEKFLADTFAGTPELIDYMQQLFGYAAIGEVSIHILPFLFGVGANGKTVILEVVRRVLGGYATTATGKFLVAGRNSEHSSEMVKLVGARMVICSETNEDSRFDEQKVKNLTGGEGLDARYLYGQSFDFVPSHTLFLVANHQPTVGSGGKSFWRRLRQIPFNNVVPDEKKNEHLIEELVDKEGPAILAWIIRGAMHVAGAGLDEPESVKASTAEYAASEDVIGQFLDECTSDVRSGPGKERTSAVWGRYRDWCEGRGLGYKNSDKFSKELRTRGYEVKKSTGNKSFIFGIDLLAPDEEDQ